MEGAGPSIEAEEASKIHPPPVHHRTSARDESRA